jgi:hypothetical protein
MLFVTQGIKKRRIACNLLFFGNSCALIDAKDATMPFFWCFVLLSWLRFHGMLSGAVSSLVAKLMQAFVFCSR